MALTRAYKPPVRIPLTDDSETLAIEAPGAGQSLYVTLLTGSNDGTSKSVLDIKAGQGGTIHFTYSMGEEGGGFALIWPEKRYWKLPEDTALYLKQSAVVNSYVTIDFYVAEA